MIMHSTIASRILSKQIMATRQVYVKYYNHVAEKNLPQAYERNYQEQIGRTHVCAVLTILGEEHFVNHLCNL